MPVGESDSLPIVELIHCSKEYRADGSPVSALRDVNLSIEPGSFTAIVGRSGCGKSTLLNLAGAVDLPTSGDVLIDRRSTKSMSDDELSRLRRRKIGFVFQFFNLLPTLTVAENVELPLLLEEARPNAARRKELSKRVAQLLEMVEIGTKARSLPHQLSGGEMQRAAIARALVHNPALIVADEPTGNLDSSTAETVLNLLRKVAKDLGQTVLMATHSKEAAGAASRVLSMRDGRLLNT